MQSFIRLKISLKCILSTSKDIDQVDGIQSDKFPQKSQKIIKIMFEESDKKIMHEYEQSKSLQTKDKKINSFIHTLPKANQIFQILQHIKKSIYPFDMITNNHKPMPFNQQPYTKQFSDKNPSSKNIPTQESIRVYFEKNWLIYDKFNNNNDQELFNQNIFSIQKLKNLKNIDYMTQIDFTKCFSRNDESLLEFNSRFQSGNLSMVSFLQGVYYLLLHHDVNTSGYTNWFYFQVRCRLKGRYKFVILNYGKAGVMHNQGVKICVYDDKNGWRRGCENIVCEYNRGIYKKGPYLNFNSLSFQYEFQEDNSVVYFSYNVPYTYNDLCCFLDKIQQKKLPYFNRKLAGISLAGNRLQVLTVTNFNMMNQGLDLPAIVLMARSHPGQTVSSWIMHEFINFIISDDPQAIHLRNNFVFKLFPMVNPDGVIHGNYRCSLSGRDLNRRWNDANKQLFPQVYFIRNQIIEVSRRKPIRMILDLHGHTKKKKIFAYGCNNKNQPHRCRLFPYILSKLTNYFEFKFCNFCMSRCKFGTARISLYNQLRIPYIYTIQSSQFGTFEGHLSLKVFNDLALSLGKSFLTLFRIRSTNKQQKTNNTQNFDKFENELLNDTNLIKIGCDRDSGSESEPSVDNIKFERLQEMSRRKEMRWENKVMAHHERLKSSTNASQSLQKIKKAIPPRPRTSQPHSKRFIQEQPKPTTNTTVIIQKRIQSANKPIPPKPPSKNQTSNSITKPSRRRGQALNFINLSLSVFDQTKSNKSYRLSRKFDNYGDFNQQLFSKLRIAPRNYYQLRRIK